MKLWSYHLVTNVAALDTANTSTTSWVNVGRFSNIYTFIVWCYCIGNRFCGPNKCISHGASFPVACESCSGCNSWGLLLGESPYEFHLLYRRGYATEKQKGLLLVEKLDYIQSKVLRGIFSVISKPLRKVGKMINKVSLLFNLANAILFDQKKICMYCSFTTSLQAL